MHSAKTDNYSSRENKYPASAQGLWDPADDKDSCGLGIVAELSGRPSHRIVTDALEVLRNMEHRGAVGGDRKTGDGAGLLCRVPDRFFRREFGLGAEVAEYGIGVFFLPTKPESFLRAKAIVAAVASGDGFELLGWREVPVLPQVLGAKAEKTLPRIWQAAFALRKADAASCGGERLELALFLLRRAIEQEARRAGFSMDDFYIPSMSSRTIVYKGMFVATQFASFYPDLDREDFESAFAIVHQRYSTNTFPSWPLAQPFRMISHNGEINTLRKNIAAMRARQTTMESPAFGESIGRLVPVADEAGSDSAIFDNVFELLHRAGRPLEHVFMMMVPEPKGPDFSASRDKRAFYEYESAIMESWDGPAAMTFTDGLRVGAALDRNGLRPFRYALSRSGRFVGASEAGVLRLDEAEIQEKGMLKPGRMLILDLERGRMLRDREIKSKIARSKPYRRWMEKSRIELRGLFSGTEPPAHRAGSPAAEETERLARYFGYDAETDKVLRPMLLAGQEAVSAMGSRKPPAALSRSPVLLYSHFRQLFAQVTNPPIDPLRENLVMSLENYIGKEKNLLDEGPSHCRQLKLLHPLLSNEDMRRLKDSKLEDFPVAVVSMLFPLERAEAKPNGSRLRAALERLGEEAERRVDEGASLIVLSDRGVDADHVAIPALLAVSSVHVRLVAARKRHLAGLVVETGEAREIHHIAVLLGCGASGVNPWMVFERMPSMLGGETERPVLAAAADRYVEAVKKGLLKILSKLGISTISSYRGARLFEAMGISEELSKDYFGNMPSRFGGIGLGEIEEDVLASHRRAFGNADSEQAKIRELPWPPGLAALLTRAVRDRDPRSWRAFSEGMDDPSRQPFAFRDLFGLKPGAAIPLEDVEPASGIVSRFSVAAMSCGAISPEAHEALAAGANSVGAWSDSGEGGEDEERNAYAGQGLDSRSASRQIASGRFGVTASYAAQALELQIKIAQGAKPGEGGQLPGAKVDAYIAKLRHSAPGRSLVSPPPHHDIYSIEDLAQLVHDLRCLNPEARIAVKLGAQAGIGAVAAGVVKAGAHCVVVSSGDGGTGAAPLSSLDYAGNAWEAALPEIRQVLAMNGLDFDVVVQVDGRLRTARDVVIAAILGAREFSFGTAALVSMGCIACGQCNLDRCPVGIATQDPALRSKFAGKPEHLAAYFGFLAEDVRAILAGLGARSLDEILGKRELLDFSARVSTEREGLLDFGRIASALQTARLYPLAEEGDTDGSGPPQIPLCPAGLRAFAASGRPPFPAPDIDASLILS
ncbi:MAG TPA: glutamate synthase large subunit, partial [Rectinemataceae bacterium]